MDHPWILASNSPRRRALLGLFQQAFQVVPADIDETEYPGEAPGEYVCRLAKTKAQVVGQQFPNAGLIIAADTTVADGDEILGKPVDHADASRMLKQLKGRNHQVYTSIALMVPGKGILTQDLCLSQVPMRNYSDEEIEVYVQTNDPMDKAGAYAIQHKGFHPVEDYQGCFASVMGFPACHLARNLEKLGLMPALKIDSACQQYLDYDCPIGQLVLTGVNIG
ncbi:MAG: septum formation protein Maf [Chloroflexi bacterium HGW-Chloroflexi-3]|nr:MAG: septum formation protein Maf [Chloroflexi bacterium HGW-Chloroflexi-3]